MFILYIVSLLIPGLYCLDLLFYYFYHTLTLGYIHFYFLYLLLHSIYLLCSIFYNVWAFFNLNFAFFILLFIKVMNSSWLRLFASLLFPSGIFFTHSLYMLLMVSVNLLGTFIYSCSQYLKTMNIMKIFSPPSIYFTNHVCGLVYPLINK